VTRSISGTKFRGMMASGAPIPPWFSDPGVIALLRVAAPPRHERGLVLFLTGYSGGGKTTLAGALAARLASLAPTRRVRLLDGDELRTHLSKVGSGGSGSDGGWLRTERVRTVFLDCCTSFPSNASSADSCFLLPPCPSDAHMTIHRAWG
jgi:hypothetical protein